MARQTRKQVRRIRGTGWAGALVVALLVLSAAPAFAHHKDDHEQGTSNDNTGPSEAERFSDHDGDADSDDNTEYTEDNDNNDGNTANNVEDSGDNEHPSGKDRSVENGKSGNQGKAESNPDDSKGPQRFEGSRGDDKANGPGGTDLADQDGNNGCGNDDDFDDDNNGWCGKPTPSPSPTTPPGNGGGGGGGVGRSGGGPTVGGSTVVVVEEVVVVVEVTGAQGSVKPRTDFSTPGDEVLGSFERNAVPAVRAAQTQGAVLPFTGANLLAFLIAGLGLIGLGTMTLTGRRQES